MPNLSGLIASAIALLAVAIAWGQWYTARLKLILDLFNQRMEVYDELSRGCAEVMCYAKQSEETKASFNRACRRSHFLFRPDFTERIDEVQNAIEEVERLDRVTNRNGPSQKIEKAYVARDKNWKTVQQLYPELRTLVAPYARMDQQKPRPFAVWLRDICRR
jgi:hypothetical protein